MADKTLRDIQDAYRVIQTLICEIRGKVDDLEADARQLWEDAKEPEAEEAASNLMDELSALSDVLSNWEADD